MSTRRRAVVVLLLLALCGLAPSGPATADVRRTQASSCQIVLSDATAVSDAAKGVAAVFAGQVVRARHQPVGDPKGTWVHKVRILRVFQGSARAANDVDVTFRPARPVGQSLKAGATYLFFADQHGAGFQVARCGGAQRLPNGLTAHASDVLDAALRPSEESADVQFTPAAPTSHNQALGRMVAPGAGLALIGLLGLVLVGRLGRERA